jgi:hypothetical protein
MQLFQNKKRSHRTSLAGLPKRCKKNGWLLKDLCYNRIMIDYNTSNFRGDAWSSILVVQDARRYKADRVVRQNHSGSVCVFSVWDAREFRSCTSHAEQNCKLICRSPNLQTVFGRFFFCLKMDFSCLPQHEKKHCTLTIHPFWIKSNSSTLIFEILRRFLRAKSPAP